MTATHLPDGTPRRHPPTDAPRPRVAHDISRAAAAVLSAAGRCPLPEAVSVRSCLDATADALSAADRGDNDSIVVDALTRHITGAARAEAHQLASSLQRRHGTLCLPERGSWHRAQNLLTGGRRRTCTVDELRHALRGRKDTTARTISRIVTLWELSGSRDVIAGELLHAYHLAPTTTIDGRPFDVEAAIDLAVTAGVDGERLAWAVITRETQRHIGLIWKRANKLARTFPQIEPEDLFGFGWAGLRVALRKYDPDTAAFSTYAAYRIDGEIRDRVRAENPIPKRLGTWVRKVTNVEETLLGELGRAPTLAELADRLGVPVDDLAILPRLATTASIDELTDPTRDNQDHDILRVDDDVTGQVLTGAVVDAVRAALARLPAEDAEAVRLLDLEGLSLAEAERVSGASSRQLRQRRTRARAALAVELDHWRDLVPS